MIDRNLNYGRHIIEDFLNKSLPFNNVLDIGAGSGTDLAIARLVQSDAQLLGIDCIDGNLQQLKNKLITAFKLDIERDKFPFADGSIDVCIANQILEHTKELFWIFHEMARTVRVGGHILIGVPNLASLHNRLLLMCGLQPTPIQLYSAHIRGFTKNGFVKFLEQCFSGGFKVIKISGSNFYPFPPIIAKPLATLMPSLAWGMFLLLQKNKQYNNEFIHYPLTNKLETPFFIGN